MKIFTNNRVNYLILFVISILSLGYQDHSMNAGLDGSYFWAFNYLINFKPAELDKITFIYGPLAFLHYTVCYGWLIVIGTLFQLLVKFSFGYCLLKLSQLLILDKRIAFVLFALSGLTIFNGETYFNIIIILFLIIYKLENRSSYLIFIGLFTAFGYYYKCSIGLSGVLYQVVFLFYTFISSKKIDYKLWLKFLGINFVSWILLGLMLFRRTDPIFNSLVIYYQNIIAFNETSSLYNSAESFTLLILCGLSIIAVFFINADKTFRLFWLLIILFLYTGYTHGIVRMDYTHYIGFLVYFIFAILCCALFYKQISKYTFPLLMLSFFCYYGNISTKRDYSDLIINIPNGPRNFTNSFIQHANFKAKFQKQTKINLRYSNSLDGATLAEIKKGSVDFFPCDLMYVEANQLSNWKPRPYLQNLNMSDYFDKKTAGYFASKQSPDYLIWHAGDAFDFLAGIDNSHLLNSEFHSVLSIFSNYYVIKKANNYLLLTHRSKSLKINAENFQDQKEINNGEWIPLPQTDAILGCSIEYDFNLLRGLKKLVYRDDEFFIEYKTASNLKFKKRIWPRDAKEFIWLNPYCRNISDSTDFRNITEIRFSNTNKVIHSGKLKIQSKTLKFEGDESKRALYKWFNP